MTIKWVSRQWAATLVGAVAALLVAAGPAAAGVVSPSAAVQKCGPTVNVVGHSDRACVRQNGNSLVGLGDITASPSATDRMDVLLFQCSDAGLNTCALFAQVGQVVQGHHVLSTPAIPGSHGHWYCTEIFLGDVVGAGDSCANTLFFP